MAACAVDDAVAVEASGADVVDRCSVVVAFERWVEVHGCRFARAVGVDRELAESSGELETLSA
jgi:hypothetical protein